MDNLVEEAQDALRGKRGKRAGAAFFQIWEKEVVRLARELGTPKYRQRFTLESVRHEGEDEPLFEITCCLAVGWSLERDVEEVGRK